MNDLISKLSVLELIDDYNSDALGSVFINYSHGLKFKRAVLKLPSAEKAGKWVDEHYSGFDGCRVWHRKCSVCGYERDDDNPDKDTNYCPNCGADMR